MGHSNELLSKLRSKDEEIEMKASKFFIISAGLNLAVAIMGIFSGDTSLYRFHLVLVFLLLILAKEYDANA